jgi:phosphoserine phosphatase RsbU/P
MLSRQNIVRINIVFGILCWVTLAITDLVIIFSEINNTPSGIPDAAPKLLLISLFAFSFLVFKYSLHETESIDILDLLWRVFVTGLVATIISLLLRFFMFRFSNSPMYENPYIMGFIYHINVGLIIVFLMSTFVVWKKLTLYQKSRTLVRFWRIYQYALFISLFFIFLNYSFFDAFYIAIFVLLMAMGIVLSINLKWVAYLDFKQKWKSILLILLSLLYLWYFFDHLSTFPHPIPRDINLIYNVASLALFSFISIYAIFSLLVLLFNLPTSSVFEQKLEEVLNFQRLSQSPQSGQNEEQILEILLESSVSAVLANAAWLEIVNQNNNVQKLIPYKIDNNKIQELKTSMHLAKAKNIPVRKPDKSFRFGKKLSSLKDPEYKSMLSFPVIVQGNQIGTLVLLKDVVDGFNNEMVEIIKTFVRQASITIENYRLLAEAIVNERYKEELKIAKKVQKSLLPDSLESNDHFDITAFSRAADEVGGDYYDIYKINENKIALIIGDVSGKGTSAAFHMSQMKGVFHSLVQLDLSPKDFIVHANNALSRCLEKSSFITGSYFLIDTKAKTIEFARAGHCPTLYYSSTQGRAFFITTKGLGLGILRNNNFSKYIEVDNVSYCPGDIMFLYTDGITEAKNTRDEFFGYDRVLDFVEKNKDSKPVALQAELIKELYLFCDKQAPEDDFTTLIVKFK